MGENENNLSGKGQPESSFGHSTEHLFHRSIFNPPPLPGLLGKIDDYEVLRLIGAGGMGLVFLARDTQSSSDKTSPAVSSAATPDGQDTRPAAGSHEASSTLVAVKVLKPELIEDRRAVTYFLRETRHMQVLEHPHIVKVLAISTNPERPYFVMPYIEGRSLARLIQSGKPLAAEAALNIARQIASVVAYAHSRGISIVTSNRLTF